MVTFSSFLKLLLKILIPKKRCCRWEAAFWSSFIQHMKIPIALFLIAIITRGCVNEQSGQDKAEAAVKKYIKLNANVASSYKPIQFGKLDSIYRIDTGRYEELDITRKEAVTQYNASKAAENTERTKKFKDQLLIINKEMENTKSLAGLRIYHVFHGKNTENTVVVNRGSFYLDSNFVVNDFVMSEDSVLMSGTD